MSERRRVIFEGLEAQGLDTIEEQVKKATGIDITKSNQYVKEFVSGFSDDEGISETGYTKIKVVRVIPSMEIEEEPIEEIPQIEKPIDEKKKQDMLDKYYGNRKKEIEYQKRYRRFKKHIADKEFEYEGPNGEKLTGVCKTIEDYLEKAADEEFLQLQDYSYKLERLSRAEAGDTSMYQEPAKKFEKIKKQKLREKIEASKGDTDVFKGKKLEQELKEMEEHEEESIRENIKILQQADSDYLQTNNFAYNQHQTTQSNLTTLGKYGEKVPFLKMSKGKDAKTIAKNIGKGAANIWLAGRNYIAAPIDKAIGTYMVAPIHRILYNSEKNASGVYKGIASHRYTARKDYFTYEYLKKLDMENKGREANGQPPKKPSILKLAFGVRLEAIRDYKQGNIAVLSAGAHDIEEDTKRKEQEEALKRMRTIRYDKAEDKLMDKINLCKYNIEHAQTEEEKLDWEAALQEGTARLVEIRERIKKNDEWHIDSVIQTDAISLAQHDKANKANITRVVSGVKTVARIATMKFIAKNLSKFVAEKTTEQRVVPEETITTEQWVEGGITEEKLRNITPDALIKSSKNRTVSYDSLGGRTIEVPEDAIPRGIALNDVDGTGKVLSSSDGVGYDIAGITDFKSDVINPHESIFEPIADTLTKGGYSVTEQELIDQILNSPDPVKALELFKGSRLWVSDKSIGVGDGWYDFTDALQILVKDMKEGHMETITQVIPAHMETVVSESMKKVIDWRWAAVEGLLAAGGARDLYELARRTKSKEEMQQEGTHQGKVSVHQRDNKPKERQYYANKYGFEGTKKGDYASDYDENKMGKNTKYKPKSEDDREM